MCAIIAVDERVKSAEKVLLPKVIDNPISKYLVTAIHACIIVCMNFDYLYYDSYTSTSKCF